MAWIKTVTYEQATGLLKRQYDAALKRAGKIFNIVSISSAKPELVRHSMNFYVGVMHSPGDLTRAQKEMIAVVSEANDCFY